MKLLLKTNNKKRCGKEENKKTKQTKKKKHYKRPAGKDLLLRERHGSQLEPERSD